MRKSVSSLILFVFSKVQGDTKKWSSPKIE